MAGSIVVDVRRRLIDALKAAFVGDISIDLTYAYNWSDAGQRKSVFTNRARGTHDIAGLRAGRLHRNETVDFDLVVLVHGVGMTADETDDEAIEIGTVIEEWIADNKNNDLGIAGLLTIRVTAMELVNRGNDNGSISELTYTVQYTARLT